MSRPTAFVTVGQQFGRLTVTDPEVRTDRGHRGARCECVCGTSVVPKIADLRAGRVQSCGCLKREQRVAQSRRAAAAHTSHGLTAHPLYQTWYHMLARCEDPVHKYYKYYGGRGITVCLRWHDVRLFIEDIERDLGPRPPGLTLDRIDNDGNYEPGKVRWATRKAQAQNRRNGWTPERRAAHSKRIKELHAKGLYAGRC
jgi:hypothetical protein